jgi:glutathione synthase/RimK-type ligase-like ATP-grasp enzyme
MKNILILTSDCGKTASWKEREQYVKAFAEAVEQKLEATQVSYATYSDLHFAVLKQTPVVFDAKNGRNMEDYSFVHFKNWQYELELASVLAGYLDHHHVPFANTEVNNHLHFNKLSQMFTLAFAGIPVPETIYGHPVTERTLAFLHEHLTFPMIVKAVDASRGDNNYLIRDAAGLDELLEREPDMHFIFQEFIPNVGDYRVLYIGLDQAPLVFLRKGDESTHLNNTSKGGQGSLVPFAKLTPAVQHDALAAATTLGREIGGVDVIIDTRNDRHYILEVNSTPALATGFAGAEKIDAFVRFIQGLTEEKEEE